MKLYETDAAQPELPGWLLGVATAVTAMAALFGLLLLALAVRAAGRAIWGA